MVGKVRGTLGEWRRTRSWNGTRRGERVCGGGRVVEKKGRQRNGGKVMKVGKKMNEN